MNILHIAPIGHHAEGIGSVLQKIVPLQISQGNDVRIISVFENLTYHELPISTIVEKRKFETYLDKWNPEIVIFHSVFNLKYGLFYQILDRRNIPYVIQLHGALSIQNYKNNTLKKRIALFLWIRRLIEHAKSIIYLNEAEYRNSIVPSINPNYSIIPNGCDRRKNIEISDKKDNDVNIVFIGRLAYMHKGLDVLLEALDILEKKNVNNFNLIFFGNEDDIDAKRLKKDIANLRSVSYGGGIYGEMKDQVLRNTDIFILTSRYEGMPMGVLEAWSYGIPCILTYGTNMVSAKHDTTYYWYADLDSKSIADTITRAICQYRTNPKLYKEASLEKSKKYEWTCIAEESIKVYSDIIGNK